MISHFFSDSGHSFYTALVTAHDGTTAVDEQGNVIAVISEDQLRNTAVISEDQLRNTAYEYIPSQDEQHSLQTLQTRDALQAAMESAEVDKIELLRVPEDHNNIIFENSDSNSQSQSHVSILKIILHSVLSSNLLDSSISIGAPPPKSEND